MSLDGSRGRRRSPAIHERKFSWRVARSGLKRWDDKLCAEIVIVAYTHNDTWQLVTNASTAIVTFLMVFLIQNTQSRDTGAMQVKLDGLILVITGAHNRLLDLEEMDEKDLEKVRSRYKELAAKAKANVENGNQDTETPPCD